jgi:UPF0042 nucleotide-binding protein
MAGKRLELAVITGLSGAGKSDAMATFEDMGYFCIDNLPPQMLTRVIELFDLEGSRVERLALVFDARGGECFEEEIQGALDHLREAEVPFRLVFLEASDDALVTRYQSTRRPHPLCHASSLLDGIRQERRLLEGLRDQADLVIDTSDLNPRTLRRRLEEEMLAEGLRGQLFLSLVSFGYKRGLPEDADIVLDVRFLPNPYWSPELRPLSGLDLWVRDFVLSREEAGFFLDRAVEMIHVLGPKFVAEQKPRVVLAIGCTGGRHRSVCMLEELASRLRDDGTLVLSVSHRDIDKGG